MEKPRILILMHYMELGGAEMALLGLLNALDPGKVDVDLFIYSHQGPLMRHIPKWVNLLPEVPAYANIETPMIKALSDGQLRVCIGRLKAKLKHFRYLKRVGPVSDDASLLQYVGDCVTPVLPDINKSVTYDLCISFLTPHNIGREKVRALKKVAWIHTDYAKIHINVEQELQVWSKYDHIVSISNDVTSSFVKTFPSLRAKIVGIENIIPKNYIAERSLAANVSDEMTGEVNLLSVGRFSHPKNFDNIPDITRLMRKLSGKDIKWHIIGYGGDEQLIRQKISECAMEGHVVILGKKENPYPYIKACDIYVQPSRYEGKSITVREAQILCKPVAVANYPTASSQIIDGVDGVILPLDNEGFARGLTDFIDNKNLQRQIIGNLNRMDYAMESEVDKIYELLK